MVMRTNHRRTGLSLAEVLIAIFVLGLGLMGVLSLFPLGAVRMAQAIKDDRTAVHSLNTAANWRNMWKEDLGPPPGLLLYPQVPQPSNTLAGNQNRLDPLFNAMENPNYAWNPDLGVAGEIPAAYRAAYYQYPPGQPTASMRRIDHNPSYPVLVDPIGWNNTANQIVNPTMQYWVGGRTDCIPRRSLRRIEYVDRNLSGTGLYNVPNAPLVRTMYTDRYFVLMDDIGFGRDGTPLDGTGNLTAGASTLAAMNGQVQRDGRYTCAVLLRRTQNNLRTILDMTTVVFSGRPSTSPADEAVFTTRFIKGSTEATVFYTVGNRPKLRKGNWILDGTMVKQGNGQYVQDVQAHGVFYRIINLVEDVENGNPVLRLELQEPAEASTVYADGTVYGLGVVMDNVVEVFPGKALTPNSRPVP